MKEQELFRYTDCAACRQKIGHTGPPLFWRVTIERFGVDLAKVRRQDGLAVMLGSARLAAVMGPDEELATPMMEPVTVALCETCAMGQPGQVSIMSLGLRD